VKDIHAITAFSRWDNLSFYLEHLADTGIIWHPIVDDLIKIPDLPWVQPFQCHNGTDGGDVFYRRLNTWIRENPIEDDDYYIFLNDDDWFDKQMLYLLSFHTEDVVFAAMLRGNYPVPGHPSTPLIPYKGVRAGSIGVEQIILKGRILKTVQFDVSSGMADGKLAESLQTTHDVKYAPELVMYFNYLEPGRW